MKLCKICNHNEVCKYKEDFKEVEKETKRIKTKIMATIEADCIYHEYKGSSFQLKTN